ncbi:hypothetical protein F4809DRAFT_155811 [Biscogniauxia mediterranea]|nr:hypothetical protein F4809DRAFT_155811 [Biscogniauxia mediterranea]
MGSPDMERAAEGHNASPQIGVAPNPDPALDISNEHRHAHLHHGGAAADHANHPDEPVYSSATPEKSFDKARDFPATEKFVNDEESGNVGHIQKHDDTSIWHMLGVWYRRFKIYVHLFVWLVWTALVLPVHSSPGMNFYLGPLRPIDTDLDSDGGYTASSSFAKPRTG